jgi:hypothetical protein
MLGEPEHFHGPEDQREPFAALVDELVYHYCHKSGVDVGETVTVHADISDGLFTLQIGVGEDAAAWLVLQHGQRITGGM